MLLTASNARAVALRAGESASGFKPLTDFIDQLAKVTIKSSARINASAALLSQTSTDLVRVNAAINHFQNVYQKAKDSEYLVGLDDVYYQVKRNKTDLSDTYYSQKFALISELEELSKELRTAIILATLSRVEASQADEKFQEQLNNVANNVEILANQIRTLTAEAEKLAEELI